MGGDSTPRSGRAGAAGALTGVPLQGAAGGLLPQMREEEVPGGLEVLEVAELDDGAGHGSGDPRSGIQLASPPPAPATPRPPPPPPPPPRSRESRSRAGAGTPGRKPSAPAGPPSERCACAGGPRDVTGGGVDVEDGAGSGPSPAAAPGDETSSFLWLSARDDLIGRRPSSHLTSLLDLPQLAGS